LATAEATGGYHYILYITQIAQIRPDNRFWYKNWLFKNVIFNINKRPCRTKGAEFWRKFIVFQSVRPTSNFFKVFRTSMSIAIL
jgi:hypothetical protein